MPFLLDMSSRAITYTHVLPGDKSSWKRVFLDIMRLVNDQNPHFIEWEPVRVKCLVDFSTDNMIFEDRGTAFDVEYWFRGTVPEWNVTHRETVDYSDLDMPGISDEQYARNLLHQYRIY